VVAVRDGAARVVVRRETEDDLLRLDVAVSEPEGSQRERQTSEERPP
jgi:diaminopimelate decarboxylase